MGLPEEEDDADRLEQYWQSVINFKIRNTDFNSRFYEASIIAPGHPNNSMPLWWINPLRFSNGSEDVMGDWNNRDMSFRSIESLGNSSVLTSQINLRMSMAPSFGNLQYFNDGHLELAGRAAGLSVVNSIGLDEVVVTGYGTQTRSGEMFVHGSLIRIRGVTTLTDYKQPMVILDGVPYEGDLNQLDPGLVTDAVVLKGADASALYGARAASGVLIISTRGAIVFPSIVQEPQLPPRKNFSESAFFFPAIYAGGDGYYSFTFTMPESVTESDGKCWRIQRRRSLYMLKEN